MKTDNTSDIRIHENFSSVFGAREYRELLGRNQRNLIVLLAIFFVTFTAIGFSNGSINYLAKKMKNPFVNWVNVDVNYLQSESAVPFKQKLNESLIRQEYNIANVTAYNETPMNFWDVEKQGTVVAMGRSVELHDPILNEILNPDNKITGKSFDDERDVGFIVKAELLSKLGYPSDARFVYWRFKDSDTTIRNVPIPVVAIVKALPGRYNFAMTPFMYTVLWGGQSGNPFNPTDEKELYIFVATDQQKATLVFDSVKVFFDQHYPASFVLPLTPNNETYKDGFTIKVTFRPRPNSILALDSVFRHMMKGAGVSEFKDIIYRYHDHKGRLPGISAPRNYHYLSVNFSNLARIRDFSDYLLNLDENYRIDIAQVEAKENYDFISRLTRIISFILIIFSVYAVSLFLSNVLRMHLEKISVNLGTLMAFGVNNKILRKIYLTIVLRFVAIAMAISLIVSALFGHLGGIRLLLRLFSSGLEAGQNYYSIINIWTLLTIAAVVVTGYFSVSRTLEKMLRKTPGDLVYERD
jgi:hypothetical protein